MSWYFFTSRKFCSEEIAARISSFPSVVGPRFSTWILPLFAASARKYAVICR